jgi:hypothetical protein
MWDELKDKRKYEKLHEADVLRYQAELKESSSVWVLGKRK